MSRKFVWKSNVLMSKKFQVEMKVQVNSVLGKKNKCISC